jgi:hypothetical protein
MHCILLLYINEVLISCLLESNQLEQMFQTINNKYYKEQIPKPKFWNDSKFTFCYPENWRPDLQKNKETLENVS